MHDTCTVTPDVHLIKFDINPNAIGSDALRERSVAQVPRRRPLQCLLPRKLRHETRRPRMIVY